MGLTLERQHLPDIQQYLFVRVIVTNLDQRLSSGHLDTQLLEQLARQGRLD